jgi:hypothetical protein
MHRTDPSANAMPPRRYLALEPIRWRDDKMSRASQMRLLDIGYSTIRNTQGCPSNSLAPSTCGTQASRRFVQISRAGLPTESRCDSVPTRSE